MEQDLHLVQRAETRQEQRPFHFTEERMAQAMAAAVKAVMTDPQVIAAVGTIAFAVLQQHAAEKTGGWLLKKIRQVFSHWLVVGFIVLMAAKYLGLPAALHLITASEKGTP